jgi:hypothetical protein
MSAARAAPIVPARSGHLSGVKTLDETESEPVDVLDGEALVTGDRERGPSQKVHATDRDAHQFQGALDPSNRPDRRGDVIGGEHCSTWTQHSRHFRERDVRGWDGAERERAHHGVEGCIGEVQSVSVPERRVRIRSDVGVGASRVVTTLVVIEARCTASTAVVLEGHSGVRAGGARTRAEVYATLSLIDRTDVRTLWMRLVANSDKRHTREE